MNNIAAASDWAQANQRLLEAELALGSLRSRLNAAPQSDDTRTAVELEAALAHAWATMPAAAAINIISDLYRLPPDSGMREAIWRRLFPSQAPLDGIDWAKLVRLNLPGGHIRNIALNAAFLAAEAGAPAPSRTCCTPCKAKAPSPNGRLRTRKHGAGHE